VSLRQSTVRKTDQALPDLFHCNGRIFVLVRMRLDRGLEPRRSCFALNPAKTTSRNRELSRGPISRGLSFILFTPERTSKHTSANRNPFAPGYSIAVLVLCASGSFGIVRFENKQTAQGGHGADPDVESGFKDLIKC
jgi:hypothetical protein